MNSFYGGKQGHSFIISKTYATIQEMVTSFGKNNSNCPVSFGEYVLINTVNKSNPENGQIFRRGYDYNSSRKIVTYQPTYGGANPYESYEILANGAEYIGTIVGPSGHAPVFNFGHYENVQNTCALLQRTFAELGLTTSSLQSTILSTLNKQYPNGYEILKEGETKKDFYSLKLVDQLEEPTFVRYFCFDNKYKLNSQAYTGWYAVDSVPLTGQGSFTPDSEKGLIPGVTYAYNEKDELLYDIDKNGNRHMRKGTNDLGNTYQDSIDWTYCTVRNENLEDSTAYIGFRFGSPVVEFETKQVDAYYNRNDENKESLTKDFKNINLITRIVNDYTEEKDEDGNVVQTIVESRSAKQEDIENHPFYSLWEIAIPKGIKGESICNFRVITANENVKALDLKDGKIQYDEKGYIKTLKDYSNKNLTINKQDDIAKQRQIFVFDIISYDRVKEGDIYTIYAGDYNVFKQDEAVKLDHNGQLTFTYTHDNPYLTKSEDWIHWIDKMHFKEDGTVTITFNDTDWNVDQSESQDKIENGILTKTHLLHWINQMNFADDGTVTVKFNNEDLDDGQIENGNITLPQLIKWITEVKLNEENGKFEIDFNYPEKTDKDGNVIPDTKTHYENDLTWLKYFDVDEQGNVTYKYTHDTDTSISRVDPHFIKWIKEIKLDKNNGHYFIKFNYDKEPKKDENGNILYDENGLVIYGDNTIIEDDLTWLKYFNIDNEGNITYKYTYDKDESISRTDNKVIKWINKISLDKDNGHLYIEFNNNNVDGLQTKNIGTEEEPKFVSVIEQDLTWVKDIEFKNDGTVITDYTTNYQDGVDKREQPYLINWINQMNFSDNGTVTVDFNNENINNGQIKNGHINLQQLIKWVTGVTLNKDNGHFNMTFNQYKENEDGSLSNEFKQYDTDLTWIKDIKLDNDGTIHWEYTTSTDNHEEKNYIKWINDIIINDDGAGNGNQKVSIKYNTSNDYIDVGSPLNYVMRMAVNPTNGDLLALYSDPEKRKSGYTYDGVSGWTVLGNIKYSTTLEKTAYKNLTPEERVENLIAGAICYSVEEID